ncbi:MAG: cold shock domain-containing protein, partial [Gammaproteobacteria bacterium]|nr:cold shock domain-containing protein [Gammaproteobacteria bacterium]
MTIKISKKNKTSKTAKKSRVSKAGKVKVNRKINRVGKSKISKLDPFFNREASKYKDPIPSREFIIQHLEKSKVPGRYANLIESLGLGSKKAQEALRRRLNAMMRDGQILLDRKGRYALIKQMDMLCGYVICHKDGYGFLVPDDGTSDIFLNPRQIRSLFPGDKVLVSVTSERGQGKREGAVVEVLSRNFTHIVGSYMVEKGVTFIKPSNKSIAQDVIIPPGKE